MRKRLHRIILWIMPFLLASADAWAWELATHVYFAQLLLWSVPLLERRFRTALARPSPGSCRCLPDLALVIRLKATACNVWPERKPNWSRGAAPARIACNTR